MSLPDLMPKEEGEPEPEDDTEIEQQPTGKPLDLRNRRNRQAGKLIPGRDFDPDTGEVYEAAGQTADDRQTTGGRVVNMSGETAQA